MLAGCFKSGQDFTPAPGFAAVWQNRRSTVRPGRWRFNGSSWPNSAVAATQPVRQLSGDKLPLTAFGAGRPQLGDTPFASDNCYSGNESRYQPDLNSAVSSCRLLIATEKEIGHDQTFDCCGKPVLTAGSRLPAFGDVYRTPFKLRPSHAWP